METLSSVPVGSQFGLWTVTDAPPEYRYVRGVHWFCRCTCGTERYVKAYSLKIGVTTSCGCINGRCNYGARRPESKTNLPEYEVWHTMKRRCQAPTAANYARYGGRGITVCERWRKFEAFFEDMGPRPTPSHTIERIDSNGPYSSDNCRWATPKDQARNRSNNRFVTFQGETKTVVEWSEITGISNHVIYKRLADGWEIGEALTRQSRRGLRGCRSDDPR